MAALRIAPVGGPRQARGRSQARGTSARILVRARIRSCARAAAAAAAGRLPLARAGGSLPRIRLVPNACRPYAAPQSTRRPSRACQCPCRSWRLGPRMAGRPCSRGRTQQAICRACHGFQSPGHALRAPAPCSHRSPLPRLPPGALCSSAAHRPQGHAPNTCPIRSRAWALFLRLATMSISLAVSMRRCLSASRIDTMSSSMYGMW